MSSTTQTPPVEVLGEGRVRVTCRKCGTPVTLDFGDMTREQALEVSAKLDIGPRECPGYHVELAGWRRLWRMDEAIEALYGEGSP
jgi:hypothetical protein